MTDNKPLLAALIPASATPAGRLAVSVFMAVLGTALLAVSAKVKVPFYPVPMTLQPMVVLLLGAAYGWRLGMATLALYLLEGAMGLPVFAGTPEKGIGLAYMAGPTGGYLLGFWLAAGVTGWLAEKGWDHSVVKLAAAMALGMAVLYACGVAWLTGFIGAEKALAFGMTPFLLGDAVKIAVAALGLTAIRRSVTRRG